MNLPLDIQKELISLGATLATAESCTGGNIAHQVTMISGSSAYFKGSIVAYDNVIKTDVLGVSKVDIEKHGAVSREVAMQMAAGVRNLMNTDFSVSTTGVAGPTGGSLNKPIGTIWIGIATPKSSECVKFVFSGNREEIINQSTQKAFSILYREIISWKES